MQVKSSGSLQGFALSEVKELLSLISDSKKAKEQLSLIQEDIAAFKEQYDNARKIKEEAEFVVQQSVELAIKNAALENSLKEEKAVFEKNKASLEEKEKELSLGLKKLEIDKAEFLKEKEDAINKLTIDVQEALKAKEKSDKISEDANKIMVEYSEKLEKLKAMVN
jgi:hypothetical protein